MILLVLLPALLFPWLYGRYEAKKDHGKILADGSANSLKEQFHGQNAWRRGIVLAFATAVFWAALTWLTGSCLWFLPAYLLYAIAAFGYTFTKRLNRLRGLHKFYVSIDPRASKTDQFFVRMGTELGLPPHTFSGILHTVFLVLSFLLLVWLIVDK